MTLTNFLGDLKISNKKKFLEISSFTGRKIVWSCCIGVRGSLAMVWLLNYQWGHFLNLVLESLNVIYVQQSLFPWGRGEKKKKNKMEKKN